MKKRWAEVWNFLTAKSLQTADKDRHIAADDVNVSVNLIVKLSLQSTQLMKYITSD